MTREEAIEQLQDAKIGYKEYLSNDALDIAINALEHPEKNVIAVVPCGDAVSREAVLDLIADYDLSMGQVVKGIHALPSVKPQEPNTGHWIEKEGWEGDLYYECSVCGELFCLIDGTPTDNEYNFCPNCGAKMVKPQESEEV